MTPLVTQKGVVGVVGVVGRRTAPTTPTTRFANVRGVERQPHTLTEVTVGPILFI